MIFLIGAASPLLLAAQCPAPDTGEGYLKGWGLFAVVQERIGDTWINLESRLLATGAWPDPTGGQSNVGPGNGAYRYDPADGVANAPAVLDALRIDGPSVVVAGSNVLFRAFGRLSGGRERELIPRWNSGLGLTISAAGSAQWDTFVDPPAWADVEAVAEGPATRRVDPRVQRVGRIGPVWVVADGAPEHRAATVAHVRTQA